MVKRHVLVFFVALLIIAGELFLAQVLNFGGISGYAVQQDLDGSISSGGVLRLDSVITREGFVYVTFSLRTNAQTSEIVSVNYEFHDSLGNELKRGAEDVVAEPLRDNVHVLKIRLPELETKDITLTVRALFNSSESYVSVPVSLHEMTPLTGGVIGARSGRKFQFIALLLTAIFIVGYLLALEIRRQRLAMLSGNVQDKFIRV